MILEKLHRAINNFNKTFNWRRFRRDALHLGESLLNDQGGGFMEVTHGITGTLRAQEHGHAPITFDKTEGNEKT